MLLCLKRVPLGSSPSLPSYTWSASSGARSCPRPTQLGHKAHANLVWREIAPETLQVICGFHAEAVPPGPAVWLAFPGCVGQDGLEKVPLCILLLHQFCTFLQKSCWCEASLQADHPGFLSWSVLSNSGEVGIWGGLGKITSCWKNRKTGHSWWAELWLVAR